MRLVIQGRLPGLNEYVKACRTNAKAGAKMKRDAEDLVIWSVLRQAHGTVKTPVIMHYHCVETNRKRDKDNISSFGRKVIQDALVKIHLLPGDGWAHIEGFTDSFDVDKNPRIEILLEEV